MWLGVALVDRQYSSKQSYIRLFYNPVPLLILSLLLGGPSLPSHAQALS